MRLLLGFGHKARHGKDTAAEAIVTYFNAQYPRYPEAKIFKFADALYKECRDDYGMTEKDPGLLQRVGTEIRRAQDPNYWVKKLDEATRNFKGVALITDVRFQNEANWIKNAGGFNIDVSRLNEDGSSFVSTDRDPNHPSEINLDSYNFDSRIQTKTGQAALTAELGITHALYYFGITDRSR